MMFDVDIIFCHRDLELFGKIFFIFWLGLLS